MIVSVWTKNRVIGGFLKEYNVAIAGVTGAVW